VQLIVPSGGIKVVTVHERGLRALSGVLAIHVLRRSTGLESRVTQIPLEEVNSW
jgi:hypothetical protein